jgi:hypothetical protein
MFPTCKGGYGRLRGSVSVPPASFYTLSDIDFVSSHPELHHYTTFSGLSGIIRSKTIWATNFSSLNDTSEVLLLRNPLIQAVANSYLGYILIRQGTDSLFRQFIMQRGGHSSVATSDASSLIDTLYEKIFENSLAEPFIASFCSHANDQLYEKENGLLSQWRGYGNDGGFCIVFDTAALGTLLEAEFNAFNWVQLTVAPVCYAIDDISVKTIFPALLEQCVRFYARTADGQNPIPDGESLSSLFISGATRFKHQGFREEREVRVVAIPATRKMLAGELSKHPEYGSPDRWKHVHVRDVGRIRYIALFDTLNATLPIKRMIVGPSRNQDENYARARAAIAEVVPVTRSATPFIG